MVLESMTSVWTAYIRFGSQQIGQACKRPAAGLGDVGPRWPGGSIILFFHGCAKPLSISLEDFCIVFFLECVDIYIYKIAKNGKKVIDIPELQR